jgi:phytoene synthase
MKGFGRLKNSQLHASYNFCEQISRRQAGNFYPAFRMLPGPPRRAMCALYAFFRIADDLSDEPGPIEQKRLGLAGWRAGLRRALEGEYTHPIHAALHHAVSTYSIPSRYLEAALDGVEMDLVPAAYHSFGELRNYCYHVASVVGLACIHVWGYSGERALAPAESAGIAFQLTNILRDLREDAARGRVYLPAEDLKRFGYDPAWLAEGRRNEAFRELMRFQVTRARQFYGEAQHLIPLLRPAGRAIFLVMARTYQGLLDAIEQRDYDVFSDRVRVSRWRKLYFALSALPARYGWNMRAFSR